MKRRPTQVAASLKRHPSHPRGSHVGTCIGPQTCTYRGQNACKPSAARHIHELLLSPHATSGRLGHVCNSVAASLQRHQTSHSRGSHANTCIRPQTCNYRGGKMPAGPRRHRHMPQVAVLPTSAIAACVIFTDPPKKCVCSGIPA